MYPIDLSFPWIQPLTLPGKLLRLLPLVPLRPPPAALLVEPPFALLPNSTFAVPQSPGLSLTLRIDILKKDTLPSQRFPIVPH